MGICYQGVTAKKNKTKQKQKQQNKRIRGNVFIFIRCTSFSSNLGTKVTLISKSIFISH